MGKKWDLSDFECKEHKSMHPSCLVSTAQAGGGGGVMVWGIFSWHTFLAHRGQSGL